MSSGFVVLAVCVFPAIQISLFVFIGISLNGVDRGREATEMRVQNDISGGKERRDENMRKAGEV